MVPSGQSTDKVCGEEPRLATEKEGVENDASVRFSLAFVGSIVQKYFVCHFISVDVMGPYQAQTPTYDKAGLSICAQH